jgi:hypothetical protein
MRSASRLLAPRVGVKGVLRRFGEVGIVQARRLHHLGEVTRMRREAGFLGVIKGLMGLGVGG